MNNMEENALQGNNILVKGDVSGIQEFIFNVKSDGAARELKGRSFFIKLLIEVAIRYLLDDFSIKEAKNIAEARISTSGGNFILKLKICEGFEMKVRQAQSDFTKALEFTGLNISIAFVMQTANYENDIHLLDKEARKNKYRFYSENYEYFIFFDKSNTNISSRWVKVTNMIKSNSNFKINNNDHGPINLNITDTSISLANYTVTFNRENIGIPLENYLESLFPLYENQIIQFECLSKSSKYFIYVKKDSKCQPNNDCTLMENGGDVGLEKLGILAMDVDGLGSHLGSIKNEENHRKVDTRLNTFFNHDIRAIINNENHTYQFYQRLPDKNDCNKKEISERIPKFKNKIYSVTAGGDDSFFVGKWNTILDFAIEVNKSFKKKFPELTISAGLVIVDSKFPVVRFAELAESALKQAKYEYDTKGNICLLGEVLKWETLIGENKFEFLDMINELRKLLNNRIVSGGILAKARLAANEVKRYDQFRLEDFWKMSYFLRDYPKKDKIEIMDKINMYIECSIKTNDPLVKQSFRKILPIAARLTELDKR